jgi:hypothetical protein
MALALGREKRRPAARVTKMEQVGSAKEPVKANVGRRLAKATGNTRCGAVNKRLIVKARFISAIET